MIKSHILLFLYRFFLVPAWLIHYMIKCIRYSHYRHCFLERFGLGHSTKAEVWIHAASVGESQLAIKIYQQILKKKPNTKITITCITPTARNLLKSKNIRCHYIPLDLKYLVNRWLKKIQPKLVIFIESEVWPNTVLTIKKHGIPLFLLNARISGRSYPRMLKIKSIYTKLLNSFDFIQPSSTETQHRLLSFDIPHHKILLTSNLKTLIDSSLNININNKEPAIVIASTHPNEEKKLLPFIHHAKKTHRIIIIPRHPDRSEALKTLFPDASFHSTGLKSSSSLWVIDQIGLTMQYFQQAELVIMGGSFVPKGGHNPLEPALCAATIITGPHVDNFKEMYRTFFNKNACLQMDHQEINGIVNLEKSIDNWRHMGKNAYQLVHDLNSGALKALEPILIQLSKMLS